MEQNPFKRVFKNWVEVIKGSAAPQQGFKVTQKPGLGSMTTVLLTTKGEESPTPPAYELDHGEPVEARSQSILSRLSGTGSKISTTGSMKALEKAWKELESNKSKSWVNFVKLGIALVVPLAAICILCAFSLTNNQQTYNDAISKVEAMSVSDSYSSLAESLQQERGIACVLLNSKLQMWQTLIGIQGKTNAALGNLTNWTPPASGDTVFDSKASLQAALNSFRTTVASMTITCNNVLDWYTNKTTTLIEIMTQEFRQTDEGRFWQRSIAYSDLFISKDFLGLVRAYGSRFFLNGGLSHTDLVTFSEYYGTYSRFLLMVQQHSAFAAQYISTTINNDHADVLLEINDLVAEITQNNISRPNFTASQIWFDNVTSYSRLFDDLQGQVALRILSYLDSITDNAYQNLVAVIIIVVIILVVCPVSMLWYAINNQKLMTSAQAYVQLVFLKTEELDREKKKTEGILNQLLPPTIVKDLKRGKKILPENYESVTIYYSDVKGFTALSSKSSPMEIVDLLNELYTNFDNILDRYDVYKVETIGDAYVVVSGAPRRNGEKHASEISTVALEVCLMLDEFFIPHMPEEKLLLRIGIHSGPCVAGVVGIKMPRYCLFGETVSTAARMESSGQAGCVQISSSTYDIIRKQDNLFDVLPRPGTVDIAGKGEISTYWLLGKQQFAFGVDLEKSARQVEKYKYWKM